jgi:hypothetical protein
MSRGLFRVRVTIDFVNGATATASIDEENITTIREIADVFARAKTMAEAMRPVEQETAPGWKPRVINE